MCKNRLIFAGDKRVRLLLSASEQLVTVWVIGASILLLT